MATPIIKIHNAKIDRQSTIHETLIHYFFTKHPQQVIFGFISLKLNNIMVKARPPGKDGQSMACRKADGMYAVTAVNKPSITKPTLCCPR